MRDYRKIIFTLLVISILFVPHYAGAQESEATPTPPVPPSPGEVIEAVNALRVNNGLPALAVHPVLMQVAQEQANGIASGMGGHWRPNGMTLGQWLLSLGYPLSGDLSLDGYRSENWVTAGTAEDAINAWLSDDLHTNTMLSPNRSDIGAGIAVSDQIYVVIETALQTRSGKMQSDASAILTGIPQTQVAYSGIETQAAENGTLPQYSMLVAVSTALPGGDVIHEVQYGQSLWSIAIAYHTTIKQIQKLNSLNDITIYVGQKLVVSKGATQPAPSALTVEVSATPSPALFMTYAPILSPTPTVQPVFDFSEKDRRKNMFAVIVIGAAAIFLGALFAVMTRRKPL
jgi:LysM repeat protein